MFFNDERSSSESLLPAPSPDDAKRFSSWRSVDSTRRRRVVSRRVRILTAAIVATCTLTGLLTWATTSIGPAPRVSLALASTDYRNHLNLPINGFGDQAIGRLAALADRSREHSQKPVWTTSLPIELATKAEFSHAEFDRDAAVLLIYVSAHGVNTAGGAALLPADAQTLDDGVNVASIIQRIADLPPSQQKVLLIDAVHFTSLPAFGILHNDFARQMRDLDSLIESIPNLVVIISADIDQQSYVNPELGTTSWAAAFVDALSGKASDLRDDGWIDLFDVHQYASKWTRSFAHRYVGKQQEPLLLPLGPSGESRSRQIALHAASQPPVVVNPTLPAPRIELLKQWSERHRVFEDREIHPSIVSPVLWQHFEATLLRVEAFELAGCVDAADTCVQKLNDLADELSLPTLIDSVACRAGVLSPELVGFDPDNELLRFAAQLESSLLSTSNEDAKRQWLAVIANQKHSEDVAFLRHAIILSQARQISSSIRNSGKIERQKLSNAAALIDCIRDPVQPPPQIGLILQLLARDLPPDNFAGDDAIRVARWIDLCLKVEIVAESHLWWTPAIIEWSREAIKTADQNRRLAGDLLFGDLVARSRADEFLIAAERSYSVVEQIGDIVSRAESVGSSGRYRLHRIRRLCAAAINGHSADRMFEHADRVEKLFATSDEINSLLDVRTSDSHSALDGVLMRIQQLTSRFESQLDDLDGQVNRWQSAVFEEQNVNYCDVDAALSVLGADTDLRVDACQRIRRLVASGAETCQNVESIENQSLLSKKRAATRGYLALAAWSSSAFESVGTEVRETKTQVRHRLLTFEADPKWWSSLQKAGSEIGKREYIARQAEQVANNFPIDDLIGSSIMSLELADCLYRQRQKSVGRFLAFQSDRIRHDGLWSFEQAGEPYYLRVSDLLSSDSITLLQGVLNAKSESRSDAMGIEDDPMGFDVIVPEQLIWTTQKQDSVKVSFHGRSESATGFVTTWFQPHGTMQLLHPTAHDRTCRSVCPNDSRSLQASSTSVTPLTVTVTRSDERASSSDQVEIFTYFRGRNERNVVELRTIDHPDVQIVNSPKPKGGRIAIRSKQQVQSGEGSAVTIVLDCSGSMGTRPGEPFGPEAKYFHAVSAVETLLDSLPTGTKLSIWAFGQAIGPSKTVHPAEQSIRQIQASVPWDASDSTLRQQVVSSISYPQLEPWNESPLFATMLAAQNDLKNHIGTRSLIVITDGFDNRIERDSVANPLSLPPREWLIKTFNETGVTVNVIAFRVEDKDKLDTRHQLATVEQLLPSGKYLEIDQAKELAETLRQLMLVNPVVELQRHGEASEPAERLRVAISDQSETAFTWTERLSPGLYQVADPDDGLPTLVHLRDGDQLVLQDMHSLRQGELNSSRHRFALWPVLDHELRWCHQKQAGRWRIGLQPLVSTNSNHCENRLLLSAPTFGDSVSLQSPHGLWIEASRSNQPLKVRWRSCNGQPCAAYDVTVEPTGSDEPEISVWVSDQPAVPCASLHKSDDFSHLGDLAPADIQVNGGSVRIVSATIEPHEVVDHDGLPQTLPCLVLRAEMPMGALYFLRTEGLHFDGFDEQYYRELGQYTLRQWPVTNDQVAQSLSAVHLISIEQFKESAESCGGLVTFKRTVEPSAPTGHHITSAMDTRSLP